MGGRGETKENGRREEGRRRFSKADYRSGLFMMRIHQTYLSSSRSFVIEEIANDRSVCMSGQKTFARGTERVATHAFMNCTPRVRIFIDFRHPDTIFFQFQVSTGNDHTEKIKSGIISELTKLVELLADCMEFLSIQSTLDFQLVLLHFHNHQNHRKGFPLFKSCRFTAWFEYPPPWDYPPTFVWSR